MKSITKQLVASLVFGLGFVVLPCHSAEHAMPAEAGPESLNADCSAYCDNCVLYASCRQPKLPTGLWTLVDKEKIINSHSPVAGDVAIMATTYASGHVGYVVSVKWSPWWSYQVHIAEANYNGAMCGERTGTESALNILGYYHPTP